MRRTPIVVAILVATPAVAEPPGGTWDTNDVFDGITVRTRPFPGDSIREVFAEGTLEGSVSELRDVLADADHLFEFMPYMKTSRVLKKESDGSEIVYVVIDPPVIGKRDYVVRSRIDVDSASEFHNSWVALPDYLPKREAIERIRVNQGYWSVRPAGPGHVVVEHSFRTDPGGLIPSALTNVANRRGVSELYQAVQKEVLRRRVAREQASASSRPALK